MNNKSLYNRFFNLSCVELPNDLNFIRSIWCGSGVNSKSFKPNHDPRTENKRDPIFFMNKEQATSDRVQAKNSQAKRGTFN